MNAELVLRRRNLAAQRVSVLWLVFLLRILDVLGSNLGRVNSNILN